MVIYYGMTQLLWFIDKKKINNWQKLKDSLPSEPFRGKWKNIGGQLMPDTGRSTGAARSLPVG